MLTSISNERRMSKAVLPTNQDYSDHVMYLCIKYPCTRHVTKRRNSFIFKRETTPSEKKRIQIHRIDRIYINSARISNDTTNNILIISIDGRRPRLSRRGARGGKGGEDGETLE